MNKDDKLAFAALIEQAGVVYSKKIDKLLLQAYWEALKDLDLETVKTSMAAHIALMEWFPKPSELRGAKETAVAMRAWLTALDACQRYGVYKTIDFEDVTVNAVIRYLGGWQQFCGMKHDEESYRRREFLQAYAMLSRSELNYQETRPLVGLSRSLAQPTFVKAPRIEGVTYATAREREGLKAIVNKYEKEGVDVTSLRTI